jgi:hypothetical protein
MNKRGFVFLEPDVRLTPPQVEEFLSRLGNEIANAQLELETARDRELEAKEIYTKERDKLLLSDACPNVGRASADVTVDEREAWINVRIPDELWIYKTAKVDRENAESYVWALKDQITVVQSLGVLSRLAYQLTGRRNP